MPVHLAYLSGGIHLVDVPVHLAYLSGEIHLGDVPVHLAYLSGEIHLVDVPVHLAYLSGGIYLADVPVHLAYLAVSQSTWLTCQVESTWVTCQSIWLTFDYLCDAVYLVDMLLRAHTGLPNNQHNTRSDTVAPRRCWQILWRGRCWPVG